MSMSDIGYSTGLSKTKVFDILHEGNTSDDQIFLRHNLAVNLYKNGLDLIAYADLVLPRISLFDMPSGRRKF